MASLRLFKKTAVIGENDWSEIDLSSGIYSAYKVDDNLMVMKSELGKPTKEEIKKWNVKLWHHSGSGCDVDGGTFGFFDLDAIEKLSKDPCDNNLPIFNVGYKKFEQGVMIGGKNLEKKQKMDAFGFVTHNDEYWNR